MTSQPPPAGAEQTNTLSTVGIVLGIIAVLVLPPLFGIAGLVAGGVARRRGERLATVALAVSAFGLVVGMLLGSVVYDAGGA